MIYTVGTQIYIIRMTIFISHVKGNFNCTLNQSVLKCHIFLVKRFYALFHIVMTLLQLVPNENRFLISSNLYFC